MQSRRAEAAQGQKGGRHGPWDGNAGRFEIVNGQRLGSHDHGAVAVAHATAAGQKGILVQKKGISMDADGGDIQFPPQGPAVERFDVLQFVPELKPPRIQLVVSQGIKHEGIVGVWAVADSDELFGHES